MDYPIIVGHRGAKGLAPEDTLKAFDIGCDFSDIVESDVHLTKDKQLVVIHDDSLERIVGVVGNVGKLTLTQLRQYDFGQKEKIPLLSEVYFLVSNKNKGLIIEIKGDSPEQAQEVSVAVQNFLLSIQITIPVYLCSFWGKSLIGIKEKIKNIQTFILIEDSRSPKEVVDDALAVGANGAGIRVDKITTECTKLLHDNGLFLNAWVVDDVAEFDRIKEMGADWITTNYPDRFKRK
jgi:glycerophosphoryl diester phosphodiesterase